MGRHPTEATIERTESSIKTKSADKDSFMVGSGKREDVTRKWEGDTVSQLTAYLYAKEQASWATTHPIFRHLTDLLFMGGRYDRILVFGFCFCYLLGKMYAWCNDRYPGFFLSTYLYLGTLIPLVGPYPFFGTMYGKGKLIIKLAFACRTGCHADG